jgi:hypothetical protein
MEAAGQVAVHHAAQQQHSHKEPRRGPDGPDPAPSFGGLVALPGHCHCDHLTWKLMKAYTTRRTR